MAGVAIVVVSYRTSATLARCLDDAHRDAPDAQIYLVDHESQPARIDAITAVRPWLHLLVGPENPGFGAGANRGINRAFADGATHVLLLNADVYIRAGCTTALVAAAGAGGAASPWLDGVGDARYRGGAIDWDRGYAGHVDGADDYLIGGCVMISRSAWERTGEFDESYFLYCEDVDWSLRARAAGVTLSVVPEEFAEHLGGEATGAGRSAMWAYWWTRNRILLQRRHGRGRPLRTAVRQLGGAIRDAPRSPAVARARARGAIAGLRA